MGDQIYGRDVAVEQDLSGYTEGDKKLFAALDAIRNGTDQQPAAESTQSQPEQPQQIRTVKERNDAIRQNLETELLKNTEMQQHDLISPQTPPSKIKDFAHLPYEAMLST